jgi:CRP/FNR family cyclic AMP-dependent transcriptional regulator
MSQDILPRAGILAFMDDEARERMAGYGREIGTTAGQVLIKEGDVQTSLYIVLDGIFNVSMQAKEKPVHLDTVCEGDCLGEIAIFHPGNASATVTSLVEGKLWVIDAEELQEFLLAWPSDGCAAVLGINIILSRRLKRANLLIRSNEIVPSFLSVRSQKHTATAKLPERPPPK